MYEIYIKDLFVVVYVKYKAGKRGWSLRYIEKNIVEFTAGRAYSREEVELELSKHYRFLKRRIYPEDEGKDPTLHFFGEEYKLKVIESKERTMLLMGDTFYLYSDNEGYNQSIVNRFYYEFLKEYINEVMVEAKKALKIDFPISIEYKHVKTYFGECFHKRKHVIFSLKLAKYPKHYIKSVVYHELAHFYYQNHQDGFYKLLESVFPNYRKTQAELRKIKYRDMY